jgi:hypothetical protein
VHGIQAVVLQQGTTSESGVYRGVFREACWHYEPRFVVKRVGAEGVAGSWVSCRRPGVTRNVTDYIIACCSVYRMTKW